MEVEVRFQSQVVVLEIRLADAARVFSESQGNESTLLDNMNYLRRNIGHKLVNEVGVQAVFNTFFQFFLHGVH